MARLGVPEHDYSCIVSWLCSQLICLYPFQSVTDRYEPVPISAAIGQVIQTSDRNQTYGTTLTLPAEVTIGQHIHTVLPQTVQSDTGGLVPIIKPDNHHM